MGKSKIVFGGAVLMDLTGDTVKADKMLKGTTAHGADGEPVVGTCTFDVDSSGATAATDEVLAGKSFGAGGQMRTGTMKNNGAVSGTISERDGSYTVPYGFHDGSGKVQISATERQKIIAENIREGVTILGITGAMSSSEGMKPQAKEVTPTMEEQVVLPDAGYNCLTQVTVKGIPYKEVANAAGGITVTIG